MSLRTRMFALSYDHQMSKVDRAGLGARRSGLLAAARGHVLEIGAGTGGNLAYYGDQVDSLVLTEPDPSMLRRLQRRLRETGSAATVLRAPAEDLPFEDETIDVAVSTLVLCGVSDQPRALRELHRVLRPGGELLFIEHVRADDPGLAKKQDRMNGVNRFLVGCECNRSTLSSIQAAGFAVATVEHTLLGKVPSFVRPLIVGTATTISGERYPQPESQAAQG
jgi:ubiquinone/menaquinone biosynthesis C-methylase UbiE